MIRSTCINSKSHLVLHRVSRCTMATNDDNDCGWAIGIEIQHIRITRKESHYELLSARTDLIMEHNFVWFYCTHRVSRISLQPADEDWRTGDHFSCVDESKGKEKRTRAIDVSECWNLNYAIQNNQNELANCFNFHWCHMDVWRLSSFDRIETYWSKHRQINELQIRCGVRWTMNTLRQIKCIHIAMCCLTSADRSESAAKIFLVVSTVLATSCPSNMKREWEKFRQTLLSTWRWMFFGRKNANDFFFSSGNCFVFGCEPVEGNEKIEKRSNEIVLFEKQNKKTVASRYLVKWKLGNFPVTYQFGKRQSYIHKLLIHSTLS